MPKIEQGEDGMLNISGKRVTEEDFPELAGRIGPDEAAVVIPAEIVNEWLRKSKSAESDAQ